MPVSCTPGSARMPAPASGAASPRLADEAPAAACSPRMHAEALQAAAPASSELDHSRCSSNCWQGRPGKPASPSDSGQLCPGSTAGSMRLSLSLPQLCPLDEGPQQQEQPSRSQNRADLAKQRSTAARCSEEDAHAATDAAVAASAPAAACTTGEEAVAEQLWCSWPPASHAGSGMPEDASSPVLAALSRSRSLHMQGSPLAAGAGCARHLGKVRSAADRLQQDEETCGQAAPDSCALPRRMPRVKLQPLQLPASPAGRQEASAHSLSPAAVHSTTRRGSLLEPSSSSCSGQLVQLELCQDSGSTPGSSSERHCSSPSSCSGSASGTSRLHPSCQQGGTLSEQQQQGSLVGGSSISGYWPPSPAAGGRHGAKHTAGGGDSSSSLVLLLNNSRSSSCLARQQGALCQPGSDPQQVSDGGACGAAEASGARRVCRETGSSRWSPSASPAAAAISHSDSRGRQQGAHVHWRDEDGAAGGDAL
jgi:hypothetical protein